MFDAETLRRLMDIPEIKGMKHSSLDRLLELTIRDHCERMGIACPVEVSAA